MMNFNQIYHHFILLTRHSLHMELLTGYIFLRAAEKLHDPVKPYAKVSEDFDCFILHWLGNKAALLYLVGTSQNYHC